MIHYILQVGNWWVFQIPGTFTDDPRACRAFWTLWEAERYAEREELDATAVPVRWISEGRGQFVDARLELSEGSMYFESAGAMLQCDHPKYPYKSVLA